MRTSIHSTLFILLASFLIACSGSYVPYAYDDIYYSPENDPVREIEKDPREDFNKTDNINYDNSYPNRYSEEERPSNYPESIYQNRYAAAEAAENQEIPESKAYVEDEVEYYDEDYANSLNQINSPIRSFNSYDPYQRDRILYTQDPFFYSPVLCNRFSLYDPFVPRTAIAVGYNNWNGWNVGLNFGYGFGGFGLGFNSFRNPFFYDPFFYDPFFYDPFFAFNPYPAFNYWNRGWGWNPYRGFGFRNNGYWAGYRNGLYDGRYYGNNNVNNNNGGAATNANRRINSPRGNVGSPTYGSGSRRSATDNGKSGNSAPPKSNLPVTNNGERSTRTRPNAQTTNENTPAVNNSNPSESTGTTPQRYRTRKTVESYSNPNESNQGYQPTNRTPSRTNTEYNSGSSNNNTQRTPTNVSNSRRTNTYNQSRRPVQNYQQTQQYENRQQSTQQSRTNSNTNNRSRPSYNRSTPSYNRSTPSYNSSTPSYNRSTPSYNTSKPSYRPSKSSGGTRSTSPSSTRRRR